MTRPYVPQAVLDAAHARAAARAARDWATADRLRDQIALAGWHVVDSGTDFSLELAHPPDLEDGGSIRYGRSESVPSLLGEAPSATTTVVVLAGESEADLRRTIAAIRALAPPGVEIVVVGDAPDAGMSAALDELAPAAEVTWTSDRVGAGAAWNIGLRRSRGAVVILLDPSIEVTGDAFSPLVAALDDPGVAVAGPFGLRSGDLRRFDETDAGGPAVAIEGYLLAFRRLDGAELGPVDEAFRFYRNLDIWWSLVLRDGGPDAPPRKALVVPGLPLIRHEHRGWTSLEPAERDRLSKRNFYRVLDRFRDRLDLASGEEPG